MSYNLIKMKLEHTSEYLEYGFANTPCIVYAMVDKPFAWICDGEECDFDYMHKNNIEYKRLTGAKGTTIVSSAGDWVLGVFGDKAFCNAILNRVKDWFSKTINGGSIVNNDFMYDGNKYGAATTIKMGNTYYLGIQISNKIDNSLIEKICKKRQIKKPEQLPTPLTEKDIFLLFKDCGGFYEYNSRK